MSQKRLFLLAAVAVLSLSVMGDIPRRTPLPGPIPGRSDPLTIARIGAGPGGARSAPTSATPSNVAPRPGLKRPIYLGLPGGPYDPVLTQRPPRGRSTPPTNHLCNEPWWEDPPIVQSETTIAVFGDTIVVGWNDGIGFEFPEETISGYGYSVDRGETWVDGGSVPEGTRASIWGDPTVAVTRDGQWIFASLDFGNPQGLAVNRARFSQGMLFWNPSVNFTDGGQALDKEYIEYDAAANRLYMSYTKLVTHQGRFVYSTDAGATWSSALTVATGSATTGYYPAPGIDGEVYVSWMDGLNVPSACLYCRYSSDGGQSWAAPAVQVVRLGEQSHLPPQCFNRTFNAAFPSMWVDRTSGPHRGRAYFCWCDGAPDNFDVYLAYADDKGQTWSAPIRLDDELGESEQFWPQVHVAPDGRVSVGWYDRRNATGGNSLCDFYVTQSVDGGVTWGPNRRMSDMSVAWCGVPANVSPNFGDYIEVASDERSVYGVWSDAREGGPDVLFARFDDRWPMAVIGSVGEPGRVFRGAGVAWMIPNESEIAVDPAPAFDSQAELMIAGIGLGTLATPQETDGIFQIGGEALHGELRMESSLGVVDGTFAVARSDVSGIDFRFAARSSSGLSGVEFLPGTQVQATLISAGPGAVNLFGTATMHRDVGDLNFSVAGQIHLDGAPEGVLAANQSIEESIQAELGATLRVHTRTGVVDGVTIDVPVLALGTNPPPLATVRASPNPLESSTRIKYTLSHPATGAIRIYSVDGRAVRTVAEGRFEPGPHEIPFDGKDDAGRRLGQGGYLIRFDTDVVKVAGKLFVVR